MRIEHSSQKKLKRFILKPPFGSLEKLQKFQNALFRWYDQHARDLPWRQNKDPYRIWVSEIMLQQTQVKTVIPYFERWMKQFPNLQSLANASSEKVMKAWAGLGYYRRARLLHEGSKTVLKQFAGIIPNQAKMLRKIPGIGRYTAGAVTSIAWDQKEPVLDGNVIRILTRLFAITQDVSKSTTLEELWGLAEKILPDSRVGDFNQALMELGATVCFPENPKCAQCPVRDVCCARKENRTQSFPYNSKKDTITTLSRFALVLWCHNQVLVMQQKQGQPWAGLWIFPTFEKPEDIELDFYPDQILKPWLALRHSFTRYRITLNVFQKTMTLKPKLLRRNYRWVSLKHLRRLALPSPYQKIAHHLFSK